MEDIRDLRSGKTSPEHSRLTKARISGAYSKACAGSRTKPFLFLDVRGGLPQETSWQTVSPLPGECLTHNTGESPREENASTLSQILTANAPEKYYLSPRACRGILQRASKRGKELPTLLKAALERQAQQDFALSTPAKARGIGYEEETSPTLRAGTVPAAVYENHSQDTRYTELRSIAPTVSSTYGTGGNNQPFVVEDTRCFDVRFTSDGTKNARQNCYETDTARTVDTGGNSPDSNQGGVAVVAVQGSMIGRADKNGPQGSGVNEDISFT